MKQGQNKEFESLWVNGWKRFKRDRMAMLGAIVLSLIILSVSFGPLIYNTSFDPPSNFEELTRLPPSWQHPFGTNALGQDLLAGMLIGGRISLTVGVTAMLIAIGLGTLIGSISGFCGGIVDGILMRLTDLFLALPQLPLLLLIVSLFDDPIKAIVGPENGIFILIVLVIGGLNWMSVARLVRANFLKIKEMEFVSAARSIGAKSGRIMLIHILPNVLSVTIVAATLAVSNAIITESTLSFLGLGFPPDVPTWGSMLQNTKNELLLAPRIAIIPGLAIFITVISINYIGDGLRDALDPQTRT